MANVALITLCGIPGSGKSTFCQNIIRTTKGMTSKNDVQYVHVCFDDLIPANVEKMAIESGEWKKYRTCIQKLVTNFVAKIGNVKLEELHDEIEIDEELKTRFRSLFSEDGQGPFVILLDDNMYYRSMRYSYYQIARELGLGFGTIFLNVPVDLAKERVQRRGDGRVDMNVVESMNNKLEIPNEKDYPWERYNLMLESPHFKDHNIIEEHIKEFINSVLANPVPPLEIVDEEEIAQSREICSKNTIHQVDQILRKIVSQHMKSLRGLSKSEMKDNASKVNGVRQGLMEDIQNGRLRDLPQFEIDPAKDSSSELFKFVERMFSEKLE